ncbi:hypothetical protein PF003_g36552 [Phytophthora fragariae]|nr:hypothetical protein PF003_g36552 [Phytophthora fragariae]
MDYAMDFKAIWPLLRKEKWTWKAATGIQIQDEHFDNYVKPGRKLRGGKQGEDFFNGEDELLAYVRSDKALCARLKIPNVYAVQSFKIPLLVLTTCAEAIEQSPQAKRPKTSPTSTAAHKHPAAKAQKKKTKKQMNEEAKQRRRELAAFDKVWGHRNITDADGKSVEPPPTTPASTASPPPRAEPSDADETGDADVEGISSSGNTDAGALARANADTDRPALADNADQDAGVQATTGVNSTALVTNADTGESAAATAGTGCSLAETHANVDISPADSESSVAFRSADVDSTRVSNGDDEHYSSDESVEEVTADSQDEACKPDDDEDQEGDHDVNDASDEETKVADSRPACVESSKRVLRDQGGSSPLRFDYADILDPNFVEPDGENSLDTDGEGDDDPAEAAVSESDDTSSDTSDLCKTDCLQRELSRMTELLSNKELERLHMNIQGEDIFFTLT